MCRSSGEKLFLSLFVQALENIINRGLSDCIQDQTLHINVFIPTTGSWVVGSLMLDTQRNSLAGQVLFFHLLTFKDRQCI